MKNILVVGSMNMDYTIYCDHFPLNGETIVGKRRFVQPGGKGANQASAAAKSGFANVKFISARGDDADGTTIEKMLIELGIDCLFDIVEESTGNATIIVDSNSENKIIIIAGANQHVSTNIELIKKHVEWADYVIFQNEIPSLTNRLYMAEAHNRGKVVIYNPAPYREEKNDIFKYVDYFIPNKIELSQYAKTDSIDEGISIIRNLGAKNVLVTLGTDGSRFVNDSIDIKVPAFKVKAVDTVAAGDTYVGYFVSSLSKGFGIEKSMTIASKASSITVSRSGSIVSIPFGKEIS